MIRTITSVKNPLIIQTADLKNNATASAFLLEGDKFINDTDPSDILRIFSTDAEICRRFEATVRDVYEVSQNVLAKLSGESSRSRLIAVVKKRNVSRPEKLLLLDGIQDPGNVGTMIRTAFAFGFGVICGDGTANPYMPKVVRSTAGAVCATYIERATLSEYIPLLKKDGFTVCGSALDEKARTVEYSDGKIALVIGCEGRGMSKTVAELCDRTYYIPISNVESLNAAVAAGILMFAVTNKNGVR